MAVSLLSYVESHSRSEVSCLLDAKTGSLMGTYSRSDRNPDDHNLLRGKVETRTDTRGLKRRVATGSWARPQDETSGQFEMVFDDLGRACQGWWKDATGASHPWRWNRPFAPKWISRFSLICAYLFLFMTLFSGVAAWSNLSSGIQGHANLIFSVIYTLSCGSFLCAWCILPHARPSATSIVGMVMYTLGYASFGLLYASLLWPEAAIFSVPMLYFVGSLSFVIGSVALVAASNPMRADSLDWREHAAFWGGCSFAMGSMAFLCDSVVGMEMSGEGSRIIVLMGYSVFLPGRLLFLYAAGGFPWTVSIRPRDYTATKTEASSQMESGLEDEKAGEQGGDWEKDGLILGPYQYERSAFDCDR